MSETFFVMLMHPGKHVPAIPMTDENGEMAFYETSELAVTSAQQNGLGEAYGFEVFELGAGDSA